MLLDVKEKETNINKRRE